MAVAKEHDASRMPPKWVVDIKSTPPQKSKATTFADPPGYSTSGGKKGNASKQSVSKGLSTRDTDSLKLKKAWEVAIAPAKSLPMNAIGMYMSGNSLQIFSIMMVFMLFKNPVQSIFNINNIFYRFKTEGTKDRILMVKLVYIATNLLALGLGIWKVNAMGLLPTTRSDWLAWESQREPLEIAVPRRY